MWKYPVRELASSKLVPCIAEGKAAVLASHLIVTPTADHPFWATFASSPFTLWFPFGAVGKKVTKGEGHRNLVQGGSGGCVNVEGMVPTMRLSKALQSSDGVQQIAAAWQTGKVLVPSPVPMDLKFFATFYHTQREFLLFFDCILRQGCGPTHPPTHPPPPRGGGGEALWAKLPRSKVIRLPTSAIGPG